MKLVEAVREFCLTFPEATEKLQWDDNLCFKVRGKIFVIMGLDDPRLCFKCSPEIFAELMEREDIRPAPYLGRYKWAMLERLDAVGWEELRALIRQSYEMIVGKVRQKTAGKKTLKRRTRSAKREPRSGK